MSTQPEALRLADWLQAAVQTYPQMSEDEPGGYATEVDQVMDEAAAELRRLHAENETLQQKLRSTEATLQRGREVWIASTEAWNSDVAERDALLRQAVDAWDSDEIDTDPVAAVIGAIRLHLEAKE